MAYWIHVSGNKNNSLWKFFMCDFVSDLQNQPTFTKEGVPQQNDTVCKNKCAPGSQCLCQEDGSVWLLGKDTDKWIQQKGNTGMISELMQSTEPTEQEIGCYWVQEYT